MSGLILKWFTTVGVQFCALTTLLLQAGLALAQDEPSDPGDIASVAEVLVDADRDHVPDRFGERATVRGVFTSDPLEVNRGAVLANFQDETAGILIYSEDPTLLLNRVKSGDEAMVTGTVGQYEGAEQLIAEKVESIREVGVPEPKPVTTADLIGERYSGQLVKIRGRIEVFDQLVGSNIRAILKDDHGAIVLYVPGRFYGDPEFVRELLSVPNVELIGIVGQTDLDPPFDEGYRLIPRSVDDFVFFPDPPYRTILISVSTTLLIAASITLWQNRRIAERSANELRKMTKNLQRSELKLRENQNRLRLLTRQVPAIVWSVDTSMKFTSSSGAGLDALNLKQDEVVGKTLFEYFQTEDKRVPSIAAHRRAFGGRSSTFETQWADRAYECHIEPLRDGDGKIVGAIGLALDVTARRKAERELQDQSNALRHSQKMEAVGRLAGGVAHDFNNLVTVIRGYCDLISMRLGDENELKDWFSEIKNSADRAAGLTTQLLAFSRKQVLEPRILNLNEVLEDTQKLLRRIIGEHIELITEYSADLGTVKVDKSQIEQVIMNLAVNAYDAMPQGGQLAVKTVDYLVTESESGINRPIPAGRYAMILFSDTGEGMPDEVRSRIFEPFFTTKEVGKGTGLGLSTVYGIVTQSGGFVEVDSTVGEGTTFRIYLPVANADNAKSTHTSGLTRDTSGSETILVAEDEPAVRALVTQTLREKGYRVLEAANGAEALEISQSEPGVIDCLVTDVVMPKMSGFALSDEITKHRSDINVLFVSGYAYTGKHQGGPISPDTFLAKPFSPEMLAIKIRRLLNSRRAASVQS